jgi:hypothetical protein
MSTTTHSPESLRELIDHLSEDLAERQMFPDIIWNGRCYSSPTALRVLCASASQDALEHVLREINRADSRALAREDRDRLQAEDDERRHRPMSEEELAEIAAENERARVVAERANTTEARLGRIEEVLLRIAKGLEAR